MKKKPFMSVIVPMYKVERYIKVCIDSILAQTFKDFEIIIIDDASPDNCYEICKTLYGNNEKIRILRHKKNQGLGPARNTGMKNAIGDYIYFVDSDDALIPDALEKIYNAIKLTNADVIHIASRYETIQDNDKPINYRELRTIFDDDKNPDKFLPESRIDRLNNYWQNWRVWPMAWLHCCKRNFLISNALKFQDIISEDEVFSFQLICLAEKYYLIHEPIYVYRRREGSIMKNFSVDRYYKGLKALVVVSRSLTETMNCFPELASRPQLIESFCFHLFDIFIKYHVAPFYDSSAKLNSEVDKAASEALLPIFKNDTALIKYFIHTSNIYRKQVEFLFSQNQQQAAIQAKKAQLEKFKAPMLQLIENLKSADKKFIFMSTPMHGNLGDQAIVLGEYVVMQRTFPDHKIIEIPYIYLTGELGELFSGLGYQKYIRKEDAIVLHGGGNLGNIWLNEEIVRRNIIEKFPNNRIVSFPQSVHFTPDAEGQKQAAISANIYNAHPDLHLMLRDENSFDVANKLFTNAKKYLLPDIATALFGILDSVNVNRSGVLFVLRSDKEKVRNDDTIKIIKFLLDENKVPYENIDTVINETVTEENRLDKVSQCLMQFRKSKLVITDRFHGVIFSVMTRTPVIAFKSYDTKISSGIKWFKDFPSVLYAQSDNLEQIAQFIDDTYAGVFDESLATPPPFGLAA